MQTGRVGVHLQANEAEFMAQLKRMSEGMRKMFDGFDPSGGRAPGGGGGKGPKGKDPFKESADAHARAAKLIEEQERKSQVIRDQYTEKHTRFGKERSKILTQSLVDDLQKLKQENDRVYGAIKQAQLSGDKEAAKIHQHRRTELLEEIRLRNQVAADDPKIMRGGAGAKAGIPGIGRDMLSALPIPGADKLSGLLGAGGGAAGMGAMAATAGVAALGAGLMKVIAIGTEFQDTVADMQAIIGATDEEAGQLGDRARDISKKWGVEATQGVESFKLAISALGPGVAKDQESLSKMGDTILMMAKAANMEGADATDALTVTMSQFGYATADAKTQAEQMARIANVMGAASKEGSAEIADLSESMKVAGATANNAGISIEQTAAWLEQLAPAGIKGAEAGTAFRNAILKMSSGTKEGNDALANMGLTYSDINPKAVGMEKAMKTLNSAFAKIKDPVEKATYMQKLFGMENANAMTVMMASADNVGKFTEKITGTHAAQEMAETKGKTLSAMWDRMTIALQDVALTVFDALQPALEVGMKILGGVADVIGIVVGVVVDVIKWIWDANVAVLEWTGVLDVLSAGFDILVGWLTDAGQWIAQLWEDVKKSAAVLADDLQPALTFVSDAFDVMVELVSMLVEWVGEKLVKGFQDAGKFLTWLWRTVLVPTGEFIAGPFIAAWDALSGAVTWLWNNALVPFGQFLKTGFLVVWGWVKSGIDGVGRAFSFLGGPINQVKGWIEGLIGWLKDAWAWVEKIVGKAESSVAKSKTARAVAAGVKGGATPTTTGTPTATTTTTTTTDTGGGGGGGGTPKEKTPKTPKTPKAATLTDAQREVLLQKYMEAQATGDEATFLARYSGQAREFLDGIDEKMQSAAVDAIEAASAEDAEFFSDQAKEQDDAFEESSKRRTKWAEDERKHQLDLIDDAFEAREREIGAMERGVEREIALEDLKYQRAVEAARRSHDTTEHLERDHAERMAAIRDADFRATNLVYAAGMVGLNDTVAQGVAKLDAIWSGMWTNQETIAFKALNGLYTTVKGTLTNLATELGSKALTFIAKNLAIAASWIASAVAAAAAWLWAVHPLLALTAGGGIIAGIVLGWKSIKKGLGFARGGIVPAGERQITVNEAGQEAVLNARATAALGAAGVAALNNGAGLPGRPGRGMLGRKMLNNGSSEYISIAIYPGSGDDDVSQGTYGFQKGTESGGGYIGNAAAYGFQKGSQDVAYDRPFLVPGHTTGLPPIFTPSFAGGGGGMQSVTDELRAVRGAIEQQRLVLRSDPWRELNEQRQATNDNDFGSL